MNIYFLCATKNGKDLIELLKNKIKIKGIITISPRVAKKSVDRFSSKNYCINNKFDHLVTNDYSNLKDIKQKILKKKIDYLFCISWQRIIPNWLIKHTKIMCIGSHGSHDGINQGRGRSPLNWALLLGKKNYKISIFKINNSIVDSGEILNTKKFDITDYDNIYSLYVKNHLAVSEMIINFLKKKKLKMLTQNSNTSRYLPKIDAEDGEIDWNINNKKILNFIRSKSYPYIGAFTKFNKKKIIIFDAIPIKQMLPKQKPGRVLLKHYDGSFLVQTGKDLLLVNNFKNNEKINITTNTQFKSYNFRQNLKKKVIRHYKKNPRFKINKSVLKEIKK